MDNSDKNNSVSRDRLTARFIRNHGRECAYIPFSRMQHVFFTVVAVAFIFLLILRWDVWVLLVTAWASCWYLAAVAFKAVAAFRSLRGDGFEDVDSAELLALVDEDLPVYTILVPLYREANIAGKIVHSLERLDYPIEKLDVKLLLEADDADTQRAVQECDLPPCCEVIVVPDGMPRTKPRACNYGLEAAQGEYCVIFDAEDQPEPDQLRKAVVAFRGADEKVACLQAALNYFNRKQNWLTRWFTIEYSTTFDLYLPGVQTMRVPVPLGGTSNHFRSDILRRVGGWDPFNVTEDCDLGIRIYKYGYTTRMLKSTTWEEANSQLWNWVRQRSRWVKGFLQTHLVHMRHPLHTWRELGTRGLVGFYLAVGAGSFMMIVNVFYWVLALVYLGMLIHGNNAGLGVWEMVHGPHEVGMYRGVNVAGGMFLRAWPLVFSGEGQATGWVVLSTVLFTASITLLLANALFVIVHVLACVRRRYYSLIPMAGLMPAYWVLISIGAWKGYIQLLTKPFYWEKTNHGLDEDDGVKPTGSFWRKLLTFKRVVGVLVLLSCFLSLSAPARDAGWYVAADGVGETRLYEAGEGVCEADVPAGGRMLFQRDPRTFRAQQETFDSAYLEMDVSVSKKVRARIFLQDRDGFWFQTRKPYDLEPEGIVTIRVALSRSACALEPSGHSGGWHSGYAIDLLTTGITFEKRDGDAEIIKVTCSAPRFVGDREHSALRVTGWNSPESAALYEMSESRFSLTREYFNPFDPDEIKVDVEIEAPDGAVVKRPAFFGQDYSRRLFAGREEVSPVGMPYWSYRFTPEQEGVYRLRLRVEDFVGADTNSVLTGWRELRVNASDNRGFVEISGENERYFSFSNGELFYPVGINLHAIFDPRGEAVLAKGPLPDKGSYSFDEYFSVMSSNGVNAAEIWMASWSLGLEWSSARRGYRGMGRYNMSNAWLLDNVINSARSKGIYLHLTLDNHGKLATRSDPEWDESPFNKNNSFAVANDAFLSYPCEFFSSSLAYEYTAKRNRYISARWGHDTSIFGMELWSEVNLVDDYWVLYSSRAIVEWSRKVAIDLKKFGVRQLITTHFCGNHENNLKFHLLNDLDELTYVVSDAYRSGLLMTEQLKLHNQHLARFMKPLLVTEYGGEWSGSSYKELEADVHAGVWASFFTQQAGSPMLWWHGFLQYVCGYKHHRGFSLFIDGADPRNKDFKFGTPSFPKGGSGLLAMEAGTAAERYIWVYRRRDMKYFPDDKQLQESKSTGVELSVRNLTPGSITVEFWDTFDGRIESTVETVAEDGSLQLSLPPFRPDIAVKLLRNSSSKEVTQ